VNVKDLLNVDMTTLRGWIRRGVSWWLDELRDMLPSGWRQTFSARPAMIAQVVDGGFQFWRAGDTQAFSRPPSTGARRAVLLLPPEAVLERDVDLPAMSDADRRRMIALELDRLTPFQEGDVYFDVSRAQQTERGTQSAALAVLRRSDASAIMADAVAQSLEVTAVSVGEFPSDQPPRFDFLPAIRRGSSGSGSSTAFWWIIVAVLLALNVMLLVWRDETATEEMRQVVAARQGFAQLALRVHDKVSAEVVRRKKYLERRERSLPLPILDALSRALPAPAWVQTFEWNGQSIRVNGFKDGKQDFLPALQATSLFSNIHVEAAQVPDTSQHQRFELTADVRGAVTP
jgi:general secretion pathway protein L